MQAQAYSTVAPWLMHAHTNLSDTRPPRHSRRGRMARCGARRRCAQLRTPGFRGTPFRRPRNAFICMMCQRPPSASPAPYPLPSATPPRHDPRRTPGTHTAHGTQPDMGSIDRAHPALPRAHPALPRKNRQPRRTLGQSPPLGHFITTQTAHLRHHARRGMCRRRSPTHGNRSREQPPHFQLCDFRMLRARSSTSSATCHQPEGGAIPLPSHRSMPALTCRDRPAPPPFRARATQSGTLPQGRPTPWATRPCWRKINDLTLFPHLPLDIM